MPPTILLSLNSIFGYLAFLYANRPYYDPDRLLCMSEYLFEVQKENRLKQKGILRRFSIDCYGEEQHTKEKSRAKKSEMYEKLKLIEDKNQFIIDNLKAI